MLDVKTIEVAGFLSAVEALRLPFGKECRSQTNYDDSWVERLFQISSLTFEYSLMRDLTLMSTLIKRRRACKILRGLLLMEINAPYGWSNVHIIGTERLSSESTMHTIGDGGLTIRDFDVPSELYEILDPIKQEREITGLNISEPKDLECVIRTYFGRQYEIWN